MNANPAPARLRNSPISRLGVLLGVLAAALACRIFLRGPIERAVLMNPIGTVMSRISRGKQILRRKLEAPVEQANILPLKQFDARKKEKHD